MAQIENEEDILKKAAGGDADAFGYIVKKYESMVFNVIYHVLRNREDANDVSQEVFLKLFRSMKNFRYECKFSTWIFRIAQNAAKDFIRASSKRRSVSLSDYSDDNDFEGQHDIVDENSDSKPEESYERLERIKEVRGAIMQLSDDHREIIVLRDMLGYSYEDISEKLGLEIGTVKSRINRARFAVKEILTNRNIL